MVTDTVPNCIKMYQGGTQKIVRDVDGGGHFFKLRIFATRKYRLPNGNSKQTKRPSRLGGHAVNEKKAAPDGAAWTDLLTHLIFQEIFGIPSELFTAHHFGNS